MSAPGDLFHARDSLHEFHVAAGYAESTVPGLREILHDEEHRELIEALHSGDLHAIARELADVVYVAFGSALSLGIDLDAALIEVHRANMHKARAGVRRDDGKILKPSDFVPPDMSKAVAA